MEEGKGPLGCAFERRMWCFCDRGRGACAVFPGPALGYVPDKQDECEESICPQADAGPYPWSETGFWRAKFWDFSSLEFLSL